MDQVHSACRPRSRLVRWGIIASPGKGLTRIRRRAWWRDHPPCDEIPVVSSPLSSVPGPDHDRGL